MGTKTWPDLPLMMEMPRRCHHLPEKPMTRPLDQRVESSASLSSQKQYHLQPRSQYLTLPNVCKFENRPSAHLHRSQHHLAIA